MPRTTPDCPWCGRLGLLVLEGLRDQEFGVPGRWGLRRCPSCALSWTDPQPFPEEIPALYARYYTHAAETGTPRRMVGLQESLAERVLPFTLGSGRRRWPGALLAAVPLLRDLAESTVLWVPDRPGGRLLDVGAGSGAFLGRMQARGWNAAGVEPDPEAARQARERTGLEILTGTLADHRASRPEGYDVITMSHVLEHVLDPVDLLRCARELLRPGGQIVALTPNADSLGRRLLGRRWRGLEVPRHVRLFTRRSLAQAVRKAGFRVRTLRCPTRSALWMWCASRGGFSRGLGGAALFQAAEEVLSWIWRDAGEEILLVATPKA